MNTFVLSDLELTADKSDLSDEREIESGKAALTAERWGCPYFETSAVSHRPVYCLADPSA